MFYDMLMDTGGTKPKRMQYRNVLEFFNPSKDQFIKEISLAVQGDSERAVNRDSTEKQDHISVLPKNSLSFGLSTPEFDLRKLKDFCKYHTTWFDRDLFVQNAPPRMTLSGEGSSKTMKS